MKRTIAVLACILMIAAAVPSHAFLNYLFGGDSSREAVENSALGDLRAWWTGNPVYQFNPFYSGPNPQAPQGQARSGGYGQQPAPTMQYVPPMQAPAGQYGQPMQQMQPQAYGPPPQQVQPQAYGPPMQQMQPQTYGPPVQQMQPQAYGPPVQQPMPMQQMQPQAYGAPYQAGPSYQGGPLQYGGGEQPGGGVQYYQ